MKTRLMGMAMLVLALAACGRAAEPKGAGAAQQAALKALAGMASFSHKSPYSEAISDMYLGYDAAGTARVAVVLRTFKTYEKVTAMAVVKEKAGVYVIEKAEIPDVAAIKDAAKQKKVTDVTDQIAGKTVKDAQGTVSGVDAVTGATRYRARIYDSFDLMARRALEELAKSPDWPKTVLPAP